MINVRGESFEVIDAHVHLGRNPILKLMSGKDWYLGDDVVKRMDELGIDKCIAFPVAAPHTDYLAANDLIVDQVQKYPDRIIGFGRVNPNFGIENCMKEIDRFVKLGLRGLKLHPVFEFHIPNSEVIYPIFETVRKHKIPILYHVGMSWFCTPAVVADMAMDFPEIPIIMPHDFVAYSANSSNYFLESSFNKP